MEVAKMQTIRPETSEDHNSVYNVPQLTFHGDFEPNLVNALLECRNLGHTAIVVLGHPQYYTRFGFYPASTKGIKAPFEVPDEAFMVLELVPGALDNTGGIVKYPPEFGI
jgi:putative acetyltransferase